MKLALSLLNTIIQEMSADTSRFSVSTKDFSRNRKLPFTTLIKFILGMRGNSLNKEIYDYFKESDSLMTASAFVQQRSKVKSSAFEYLFNEFNNRCNDSQTTEGYHLYAFDGTDIQTSTDSSLDSYMPNGDNEPFNMYHINTLYDISNNVYSDIIIQPKPKTNEPGAAALIVDRYEFPKNSIIMADRGYAALNLFEHISRKDNADYLIRCKNDYISEIKRLPFEEFDREICFELRTTQTNKDKELYRHGKAKYISGTSKFGKYKKSQAWDFESPYKVRLRVVRFLLSSGEYETVITSLNRFEFPLAKVKELYHLRWNIENSYRELKYAVGLINLHSRKENSVLQEIWASFIMYNLSSRISNTVIIDKIEHKWEYQLNMTMVIYICFDYFRTSGTSPPDIDKRISKYLLPVRPDRADERKLRNRIHPSFNYRVA